MVGAAGQHGTTNRHDTPTATVALAGTLFSSNIYGTVVFDLNFFNSDYPIFACNVLSIAYHHTLALRILHIWICRFIQKGNCCDSEVRTGTTCTGLVRTHYVLVPSVLLVYLSLILRGVYDSGLHSSGLHMIRPFALCRVALILRNKEYIKGTQLVLTRNSSRRSIC